MPLPLPNSAAVIAVFLVVVALSVYGRIALRIVAEGGKVRTGELGLPELLMSIVLASYIVLNIALGILRHGREEGAANMDAVLPSAVLFIAITAGIAGFMRYRGLRLGHILGFDYLRALPALGWVCGLTFAALPLSLAATALTSIALKENAHQQPLVELFRQLTRQSDNASIAKFLVSAVLIQPVCEEFLFRGFFYGVWKRYLGPIVSGALACVLFAAMHTNLASLGGLLVLAVCLTLAYERTGSLLVPIGMHALFNFANLLALYAQVHLAAAS